MLLLPTLAVLVAAYLALDGADVTGDEDDEDDQVKG